ncbi:CoA transferase [Hoeflea sp. G2-23]|uniref:CoA transferase n=1 Tax=Hoeflea algicola TaxID=2983763 RepID=A0ABT3ZBT4_9HYPH|nr:CoA transferase [Hoeflea algicola]MCY0149261.1 CoA transferase [Hoeflea algicola]
MTKSVLSGIRVLDFGRYIAGPYCSALLADQGAEVIRIERVNGNDDRYVMPLGDSAEGALYLQMNRNKKSLALDITQGRGAEIVRQLVATADVIVVNLPPKARTKLGLDYDTLRSIKSDIILTTVSAFGTGGSYGDRVGFDVSGQALSGAVYLTGTKDQPYRSAISYVDYSTGMSAAFGTMAALLERKTTGRGQHVEASLLGSALTMTNSMLIEEASGSRSRVPTGNRSPISGPSDLFATRDGWMFVQVIGQDMFERWIDLVGAEMLRGDPRFKDDISRGENGEILSELTAKWCRKFTTRECLTKLHASRVPGYQVLTPAEALEAREVSEGEFFDWQEREGLDAPVPIMRSPVSLSEHGMTPLRPAPRLGADTRSILEALGHGEEEISILVEDGLANCDEHGGD